MLAIAALGAGIIAGWFLRGPGISPISTASPRAAIGETENGRASSPKAPQEDGRAVSPKPPHSPQTATNDAPEQNDDDPADDDRIARRGIIMQQSADEVRQSIIENAGLDETQTARLDTLIADMNRDMAALSTKWANHIRETGALDINTRMKMQHELNGVLVSFSDKMDEDFPGWRADDVDLSRLVRVSSAFEPFRKIRSEILRGEMGRVQGRAFSPKTPHEPHETEDNE